MTRALRRKRERDRERAREIEIKNMVKRMSEGAEVDSSTSLHDVAEIVRETAKEKGKPVEVIAIDDPELENKVKALREQLIASTPEHHKRLGKILKGGSMASFRRYLNQRGIHHNMNPRQLKLFRDYIITKRIDLKEEEPAARANLREDTLKDQPKEEKTQDYMECVEAHEFRGSKPATCANCRWFSRVPEGSKKTCIQLGAKGSDRPCYGFELYTFEPRRGNRIYPGGPFGREPPSLLPRKPGGIGMKKPKGGGE